MIAFGFDYDGVIIDIELEKAEVFGEVMLQHWGVDPKEASTYWLDTGGCSRRSKFDYFYERQFGKSLSDQLYTQIESEFSTVLRTEHYPKTKLLPHALEIIQFVRDHFEFVFITSGIPMVEVLHLTRLNGVDHFFDLILGTNKEYPSKREHFKKVQELKHPDRIFFLADSTNDMLIGKEFQTCTIALPMHHAAESLKKAGATYVTSHADCVVLLKKLLK